MKLRYSRKASGHLAAIFKFIEIDSGADAAALELEKLMRSIDKLQTFPMLGRVGKDPGTRELVVSPYVVIYRLAGGGVVSVEAVFHGKRRY